MLYSIICTTPQEKGINLDFNSTSKNSKNDASFDVVKKSFEIKNSGVKNSTSPFWGHISISSINANWGIRSDTVNAYNSTYHVSESFYPGENGVCGILGHHTIFSAPFSKIDTLKVGDTVIINDLLTQKKYTYTVASNGDIRWNYKENPITYASGSPDLTLVTCWPPGSDQAAWLTHCKLTSIEPLQ